MRTTSDDVLPTTVSEDFNALATSSALTQNAPPPRYREGVRLPQLDAGTDELTSWRAVLALEFDGVYAETGSRAYANTQAELQFTLLGNQRRVVLTADGNLLGQAAPVTTEGVRLGQDTFAVRDGVCTVTTGSPSAEIADVRAADVLGGVTFATPDGTKAVINGASVWRFGFTQADLALPNLQIGADGRVLDSRGELWFAPDYAAAVRFYLTLDVENATVLGSTTPVIGTLIMRYDLYDIGIPQNISVPFGC
ncbi:MAG: hypothetical protein H7Y11_11520 [Armatimonadetes bacterium]|nr:hypothetical protein [Anaerolineae bacterium]